MRDREIDVENKTLNRFLNSEQLTTALDTYSGIILNQDELLRNPLTDTQSHQSLLKENTKQAPAYS